jgi:hypothetical protein
MASLISPGVSVSVIDESQYTPTNAGSVAYVLIATAQDKRTPSGAVATYTSKANAEKVYPITSQRDLVNYYGNIAFRTDESGNPLNADERNEYGLLAAYSALGVSNQLWVQRADVDLDQLTGTSIRPTGSPNDGTYWLDVSTSGTNWGVYEYYDNAFTLQTPTVITDTSLISSGVPLASVGSIGDYAIVSTSSSNPLYYKGYQNAWTLVGSDSWKDVTPIIVGSIANPANLAIGQKMRLNSTNVTLTGTTVTTAASDINGALITGVSARVNSSGQLEIFADSLAASTGNVSLADGKLKIELGSTIGATDCSLRLGLWTNDDSGNTKTLNGPTVQFSDYRNVPAWRVTDATPRPTGSIWIKTSGTGNGANWGIKEYDANLDSWTLQAAPLYSSDNAAIYGLSPVAGGGDLPVGTLYVQYDTVGTSTVTGKLYRKNSIGSTTVTGTAAGGSALYNAGNSFTMEVSAPGTSTTQTATITIPGSGNAITATTLVSTILSAGLPNIAAGFTASGAIYVSHLAGGTIKFTYSSGTPLTTTGLITDTNMQAISAGSVYLASPFKALTYTYSTTAPYSNPADGTLWYYNNALEVDVMMNDGSGWKGYRNVTSDARGYDLSATDEEGPILAATQPTQQSGGGQLVSGDLWINTSDLENYPVISRYDATSGTWTLLDNADNLSIDGIVFADARWDTDGTTDPITGSLPAITDLITSDYLDSDAPDYRLHPRGMILFNTRRSGYNVKEFQSTQFADDTNPPTVLATWVTHSGLDEMGIPYFGHKAQRSVVVRALQAAVESSTALREEQTQFNLICCPGYPEVLDNLVTLNNDRLQTSFIIGDAPLSLTPSQVQPWITNQNLATDNGENGLVTRSEYLGVYYPAGLGTDLSGNSVVVPASHMMLRTFIRSDQQSYPWFAPAGVRRGLIDNASSIGYVDVTDNNLFRSIGVTPGLRDILYASNVNPLTVLPGVGLVAYGQKTRASMTSAMDRVNVARLVCYLRLVLPKVASPFLFEPNDNITRTQVKAGFENVLNDLVAKRGIYDYLVVCDTTNNTPDRIDRNELWVDIAIQPVKAIEFIYIPVRLQNTGAPLSIR